MLFLTDGERLNDGDNASSGFGYLDIVDFIIQQCFDVEHNLKELFRRVAFYICIGNTDDHFRNHGFILTPKGWTLSPAYDINPTNNRYQSLLINNKTNDSNLNILLDSCEDYLIKKDTAQLIIEEVSNALRNWKNDAFRLGIPSKEIELFEKRIML